MNTKKIFNTVAVTIIFSLVFSASEIHAGSPDKSSFELKSENSKINWKGKKPGGEHYGYIEVVKGALETDGSAIKGGTFTIDLNTIVCEDLTNEGMNNRLVGHLKSEDFFYTEKYPNAYFAITDVVSQASSKDGFTANYKVTGDLTIRGIKNEISFPAKIDMNGNEITAKTGKIELDRTKWNVNFQSKKIFANLTDQFINDEMIITLDLHFSSK
jgi:polyisoprenoid-binding protein YceI